MKKKKKKKDGIPRCITCGAIGGGHSPNCKENKKKKKYIRESRGQFDLLIKDDGTHEHMYRCQGQTYWMDEEFCDGRQRRKYKQCRTCSVRKGGKNDPRKV